MVCLEHVSFSCVVCSAGHQAYVVDTGRPNLVATVKKSDDATKAHVMPNMSTAGSSLKKSTLMILFRMVSATRALLPSVGSSLVADYISHSPDQDGTQKFTHGGNTHGLSHGQGSRRDRGCKGVGHIIGTDVEGIQKGKDHAKGKDIVELVKNRHLDGC